VKITDIHEDVVDLSKRRAAKAKDQTDQRLSHLDHSVADAIDDLIVSGIPEEEAHNLVMQHLSDIVVASDLDD